ncbi:mitochondrial substrate carrier family protein [Cavenderia fasciculata]|uniref:Palmitoyltransferase n=1 Tax=Cavenderia fasciculata TaxID=261658 RepID=F4PTI4_CACFS|nr:mitochondrial substrate carrier family protein [Cavenderia fasciculata]EGG20866.1 mitochondrial substrate carrier family protein [Cavenderia fasciculata]|eukprot:XP_004358716.1 mitochondrial substrate carrier family protein [Cavenderia fasciculata]
MANYLVFGVSVFLMFAFTSQYLLVFEPLGFIGNRAGQIYIGLSVVTHPGFAPLEYVPEGKSRKELDEIIEIYRGRHSNNSSEAAANKPPSIRYCTTCNIFKPPRTHHCRKCKRCIVKQDHHCPWIANCVGFKNQKPFLLFLFYVLLVGTISIFLLVVSGFIILNHSLTNSDNEIVGKETQEPLHFSVDGLVVTVLFIVNLSILIPVLLGVSGLFYFQFSYVLDNITSVERFERKTEIKAAKRAGLRDQYRWRYDRGTTLNFKEVFGDRFKDWIWPIGIPKGDGINWKMNPPDTLFKNNHNSNNTNNNIGEEDSLIVFLFSCLLLFDIISTTVMGREVEIYYDDEPPVTIPPEKVKGNHDFNLKIEMIAGTLAGVTSCLVFYPLECIEAKMQVAGKKKDGGLLKVGSNAGGGGMIQQFKHILRVEGVKGLYQGVTPTAIGNAVNWGVYFTIYRYTNHWFSQQFPDRHATLGHSISAIHAGIITTAVVNPFWVLKIRLATSDKYKGMVDAFQSILKNEGVGGFWKGVGPSFIGVSEGLVQFVTYEKLLEAARHNNGGNPLSISAYLVSGGLARLTAGLITYPYLLLRSKLQVDNCQYKSIGDACKMIYRDEGIHGFYKGIGPNLIRSVPPAAMMLYIVEFFRSSLLNLTNQH